MVLFIQIICVFYSDLFNICAIFEFDENVYQTQLYEPFLNFMKMFILFYFMIYRISSSQVN